MTRAVVEPDGPRRAWPDGLLDAAWLWLVLRVGLSLFAAALVIRGGLPGPCDADIAQNGWTTLPPLEDQGLLYPLVGVWQHWDACWYTKIAAYGYEPGVSSTAFFPLLPVLMGTLGRVLGGHLALAGMVVNAIAFIVALTGLWRLVRRDFGSEVADRTVLYVAVFPVAFFLSAPFTESIFLACAVWAILGARERRWGIVAAAGLLAGLTRPQGLLLLLPLGWEATLAVRDRRRSRTRGGGPGGGPDGAGRTSAWSPLAALAPAVGFAGFFVYTDVVVGRSPVDAQLAWAGTGLRSPLDSLALAVTRVGERGDMISALNIVALGLFSVLFLAGLRRLPASYSLYVLPQLGLIWVRAPAIPLMSTMRFCLVLFPCFVVVAIAGRRRRLHEAWVVLSVLFLGLLGAFFVEGRFVG
jgi:Dolichyl-phosphate-mannose-protein mannosyltransferase